MEKERAYTKTNRENQREICTLCWEKKERYVIVSSNIAQQHGQKKSYEPKQKPL